MSEAFKKVVSYEFHAGRWDLAASEIEVNPNRGNLESIFIEETRKNGQEDCHACGYVIREDSTVAWRWDDLESGGESFDEYGWKDSAKQILEYMNSNPFPASASQF